MEETVLIIAAITFLCICLLVTLGAFIYSSGLLHGVEIGAGPPPIQEAVVAYKFARGPYKDSSFIFCDVTRLAPLSKAVGIYYDDPNVVPAEKLRYAVGAVLSEGKVKVEKDVEEQMLAEGFKIIKLPRVTNVVKTAFPYINSLSIYFAIMKVYPKMASYIMEHKLCAYPFLEVYESDVIHFFAPLARQEDFFVEEADDPEMAAIYNQDSDLNSTNRSMNSSMDDSPSMLDMSTEPSCSRSESAFSSNPYTDVSDTEPETENETSPLKDEIVSSVEVEQATTPLLVEGKESLRLPDTSAEGQSLHDSGMCSGRTSALATGEDTMEEGDMSAEQASDGNASSSSFEEIHMEDKIGNTPDEDDIAGVRKE